MMPTRQDCLQTPVRAFLRSAGVSAFPGGRLNASKVRRARTIAAWILLGGSLAGWPLCAFWLAKTEPPVVLGLSFLAIVIESASLLTASQVAEDVNGANGD